MDALPRLREQPLSIGETRLDDNKAMHFIKNSLYGGGPIENTHVYYDGPMLVFTGELDASLAGVDGYKIEMLYANATNVVFRNSAHIQVSMAGSGDPSRDWNYYRLCGAGLARQFLADPRRALDARCSETRGFRLVQ